MKVSPIPYPGLPQYLLGYDVIIGLTLTGLYGTRWPSTAKFLAQLEAQPRAPAAAAAPSVVASVTAGPSPAMVQDRVSA